MKLAQLNQISSLESAGLAEPEQDATMALTELDKGLRSGRLGEQCEAIVKFPRLFEKFPFPVLINSSLLKLADVFRVGSNFLRVWVLRVCQQSEKHLDKMVSVDEFVRRIFSVVHSNDPIARALALRTLAAVAGLIPDHQTVHHAIRAALDSHDAVEMEAAICAANKFAAQSNKFAVSMCAKVSEMIQGLATPANRKLQLIPILQHMHHDSHTASMVRALGLQLLEGYPAQDFVIVTLATLTRLASVTLVDIPDQVQLLLDYLTSDERWPVQRCALRGLLRLATEAAHLWPNGAQARLIDATSVSRDERFVSAALHVLEQLVRTDGGQWKSEGQRLLDLTTRCAVSPHYATAARAIRILVSMHCDEIEGAEGSVEDTIAAIEALFLLITNEEEKEEQEENVRVVRICLKALVRLVYARPQLAHQCIAIVSSRLFHSDCFGVDLCEALAAIGDRQPEALIPILPLAVEKLTRLAGLTSATCQQRRMQVMLCTVLFQSQLSYEWRVEIVNGIREALQSANPWDAFRIGRAAARYGHFEIAKDVFEKLKPCVASENLHLLLRGLAEMSAAESALRAGSDQTSSSPFRSVLDRLSASLTLYCQALSYLKAASTAASTLTFQTEFVRTRVELLQCLAQVVRACGALSTAPPPAIASAHAQQPRDADSHVRFGHVTHQLLKCVKELRACADMYQKLYQSAFDADPESLAHVYTCQQMSLLVAATVERVCGLLPNDDLLSNPNETHGIAIQYLSGRCKQALTVADAELSQSGGKLLSHQNVSAILQQVELLTDSSFCLPRFFFQSLQSTSVRLNIWPRNEPLTIVGGAQLAVKVEGILVHGTQPAGRWRKAAAMLLTLQPQLQSRSQNEIASSINSSAGTSTNAAPLPALAQTVAPHYDFFSAQFLLALPGPGQYILNIEAAIIDDNSHVWRTGPKTTLTVKQHEESGKHGSVNAPVRTFPAPRF